MAETSKLRVYQLPFPKFGESALPHALHLLLPLLSAVLTGASRISLLPFRLRQQVAYNPTSLALYTCRLLVVS